MKVATLALATMFLASPVQAQQEVIAQKSFIRFAVTQMGIPVEGRFRKFDAKVAFDPAKPDSTRAEFAVDVASIELGTDEGETEARRKPWLDAEGFPQARFTAASVKPLGGNRFEAHGPLTLKGVTRDITAPFTVADAAGLRTVEGQFTLKRLQYKVGEGPWSDTETVADDVLVRFRFTLSLR